LGLAIVIFAIVFMVGGGKPTRTVDSIQPGSPAYRIGLKPGDEIVAIDRHPVTPDQIPQRIRGSRGSPLLLTVNRPPMDRPLNLGPTRPSRDGGVYHLGFTLRGVGLGAGAAFWESIKLTGTVTKEIGKSLG